MTKRKNPYHGSRDAIWAANQPSYTPPATGANKAETLAKIAAMMKRVSYMDRDSPHGAPADSLDYGTRENGERTEDYDRAGKADIAHAKAMKAAILKLAPEAKVEIDTCDEWTSLHVRL